MTIKAPFDVISATLQPVDGTEVIPVWHPATANPIAISSQTLITAVGDLIDQDFATQNARITASEGDIAVLEAEMNTAQADIDAVEARVTQTEADIANIVENSADEVYAEAVNLPLETVAADIAHVLVVDTASAAEKATPLLVATAQIAATATTAPTGGDLFLGASSGIPRKWTAAQTAGVVYGEANSLGTGTALAKVVGITGAGAAAGRTNADLVTDLLGTAGVPGALGAGATVTGVGSGATARTLQSVKREVVSIMDYGAVGDGTDKTTEVQLAITRAVENGGRLYVPSGTFAFGHVSWTGTLHIFGEGILKCYNPGAMYATFGEWMTANGTAADTLRISGVTIDNNTDGFLTSSIASSYNDALSPYDNWRDAFLITAVAYGTVDISKTIILRSKRGVLLYQCDHAIISGNNTNCEPSNSSTADYGQCVFVFDECDSVVVYGNILTGMDYVTGTANYVLGATSTAGVLAFDTNDIVIGKNVFYGHQVVARVTTITSVTGRRCILQGNIIEYPVQDTAIYGYKLVSITGNVIYRSGDMGISTDNSMDISIVGNVIDGVCVGGIQTLNATNVAISGNTVKNVGQDYSETTVSPSAATAVGINIDSTNAPKPLSVAITGNTLYFDALPPGTNGKGLAIRVPIFDNEGEDVLTTVVVSGNNCHVDATNLPNFAISAAECICYINTVSGTFVAGERLTAGTSGAMARYVYNTAARLFYYGPTSLFTNGETITGSTSGATMVVESAGGGSAQRWMSSVVSGNMDLHTARGGQAIIADKHLLARL